jgi:hypothetical protein
VPAIEEASNHRPADGSACPEHQDPAGVHGMRRPGWRRSSGQVRDRFDDGRFMGLLCGN